MFVLLKVRGGRSLLVSLQGVGAAAGLGEPDVHAASSLHHAARKLLGGNLNGGCLGWCNQRGRGCSRWATRFVSSGMRQRKRSGKAVEAPETAAPTSGCKPYHSAAVDALLASAHHHGGTARCALQNRAAQRQLISSACTPTRAVVRMAVEGQLRAHQTQRSTHRRHGGPRMEWG